MNIEPNSTIYILRNVPLDNTYSDTLWFPNINAQFNHFYERARTQNGLVFENNTYQRVHRNRCRLQVNADNIYDCNYMMFRNTNYGSKWFYAFITSVEYVNNAVAEIEYEIDEMQTWFFDYHIGDCFVEREHSATDVVGDNLQPEPVELGEYIADLWDVDDWITNTQPDGGYGVLICSAVQESN